MTINVKSEPPEQYIYLRREDEVECLAQGYTGDKAVRMSAEGSIESSFVYVNGELVACWGYSALSLFSYRCYAWLLTLPAIEPHLYRFARSSKRVIEYLFNRYEEIEVHVHRDYAASIKWLKWLGFKQLGQHGTFLIMVAKRGD